MGGGAPIEPEGIGEPDQRVASFARHGRTSVTHRHRSGGRDPEPAGLRERRWGMRRIVPALALVILAACSSPPPAGGANGSGSPAASPGAAQPVASPPASGPPIDIGSLEGRIVLS